MDLCQQYSNIFILRSYTYEQVFLPKGGFHQMRKSKGLHIRRKIHKGIYSNITLMLNKNHVLLGELPPPQEMYNKEKDDAAWDMRFPCN